MDDLTTCFKQALDNAMSSQMRSDEPAKPRHRRPRMQTLADFKSQLMCKRKEKESVPEPSKMPFRHTIITGERNCCMKPLAELCPILLDEMEVPKVHKKRFLVCRTLTEAMAFVGTTAPVEDLCGSVEMIVLYNFRSDICDAKWLAPGSIMIVKEPYLKYGSQSHSQILRVDSPSDVVFVDETDSELLKGIGAERWHKPLNKTADELRQTGNALFGQKDFEGALKFYDRALRLQPSSALVEINRSAALIQLCRFSEAFLAAKHALDIGGFEEKALFRLGISSYGMRDWQCSIDWFERLRASFSNNKAVKAELQRVKARMLESESGFYDFDQLYQHAFKKNRHFFDIADYIGPVKVVDIPGKGKGVITNRKVSKGTLLVVSKAFSMTYEDEYSSFQMVSTNLITKSANMKTAALNVTNTICSLMRNPHRAKELYALHAGDNYPRQKTSIPEGVFNAGLIENICSLNSFEPESVLESDGFPNKNKLSDGIDASAGLWTFPSYLNHSCIGNCYRAFYGDLMVIHAIRDLKKGEEVEHNYVCSTLPYAERMKRMHHYKFTCTCCLCEFERNDLLQEKRLELKKQIMDKDSLIDSDPQQFLNEALPLLKQIRKSYDKCPDKSLCIHLFAPLNCLAWAFMGLGRWEAGAKALEEALECATDCFRHSVGAKMLLDSACCYSKIGKYDKAIASVERAMEIEKTRMGVGKQTFLEMYPEAKTFYDTS